MSTISVSLFTPIKYGNQQVSFRQKAMEFVDEYFHLKGRVVFVIPGKNIHGSEGVQLQPGQAFGWHSVLKLLSYSAYFFNVFITTQFPRVTAYRSVAQLQMILSSLPIFMVIAKVFLRSTSRFHIDSETKGSDQADETKDKNLIDLILDQGKATYDKLIGVINSSTTAFFVAGYRAERAKSDKGYILGRVSCLSSLEEVKQKFPDASQSFLNTIVYLTSIKLASIKSPLAWKGKPPIEFSPEFVDRHFTCINDGQLDTDQTKALELLQRLIQEGRGEDIHGLRWEIPDHPNNRVS